MKNFNFMAEEFKFLAEMSEEEFLVVVLGESLVMNVCSSRCGI